MEAAERKQQRKRDGVGRAQRVQQDVNSASVLHEHLDKRQTKCSLDIGAMQESGLDSQPLSTRVRLVSDEQQGKRMVHSAKSVHQESKLIGKSTGVFWCLSSPDPAPTPKCSHVQSGVSQPEAAVQRGPQCARGACIVYGCLYLRCQQHNARYITCRSQLAICCPAKESSRALQAQQTT